MQNFTPLFYTPFYTPFTPHFTLGCKISPKSPPTLLRKLRNFSRSFLDLASEASPEASWTLLQNLRGPCFKSFSRSFSDLASEAFAEGSRTLLQELLERLRKHLRNRKKVTKNSKKTRKNLEKKPSKRRPLKWVLKCVQKRSLTATTVL